MAVGSVDASAELAEESSRGEKVNFNDRFLLYRLYTYAMVNKKNDSTFDANKYELAGQSYEW